MVDRGTNAMQSIMSTVVFNIAPQIIDVLTAATYLSQALQPGIAAIVFITVGSYMPATMAIRWALHPCFVTSFAAPLERCDHVQAPRPCIAWRTRAQPSTLCLCLNPMFTFPDVSA